MPLWNLQASDFTKTGSSFVILRLLHRCAQEVLCLLVLLDNHGHSCIAITVAMKLHEFRDIKLGLLDDLDLPDENVLQWVDAFGLLRDLLTNGLWDELLDELTQRNRSNFLGHDVRHLLADLADLCRLSVAVGLHLVLTPLGECEGKQTHDEAICGLHIHVCLNECVPLPNQGALLVACQLETVEICQAAAALNVFNAQLDLPERLVVVLVEISEIDLQHAALELLRGNLGALSSRYQSLTSMTISEHTWRLDVIPFLFQERVARLLLATLLASLCESLVLSDSHCYQSQCSEHNS
mmetsp:Transcript_41387/g.73399  ORF Transcript_41387/g.73399 Transcript_41387/m.73399 type:complete len:296 (-) Transcript_41387:16-903(-)